MMDTDEIMLIGLLEANQIRRLDDEILADERKISSLSKRKILASDAIGILANKFPETVRKYHLQIVDELKQTRSASRTSRTSQNPRAPSKQSSRKSSRKSARSSKTQDRVRKTLKIQHAVGNQLYRKRHLRDSSRRSSQNNSKSRGRSSSQKPQGRKGRSK